MRRLTQEQQTIHAVHDALGNRIAEYLYDESTLTSTLIREYIWANGMNVAVVENGVLYFVRTDHIGRPVFATDGGGAKVWTASYKPFGGVQASTGPNSALRFPGQWFQSETDLHQNWMRDYDPTTGRYMQADPLGLVDGASVYGYALQNPERYVDPMGLSISLSVPTPPPGNSMLLQCNAIGTCQLVGKGRGHRHVNGVPVGFPTTSCTYECDDGRTFTIWKFGDVKCGPFVADAGQTGDISDAAPMIVPPPVIAPPLSDDLSPNLGTGGAFGPALPQLELQ